MQRRKTTPGTLSGEAERPEATAELLPAIASTAGVLKLGVRVSPSAPRTALRGLYGDRLKVAVNAPPEDNRANEELLEAVAGWLGMRRDQVRVETGSASRDKTLALSGVTEAELRRRLAVLLEGNRP